MGSLTKMFKAKLWVKISIGTEFTPDQLLIESKEVMFRSLTSFNLLNLIYVMTLVSREPYNRQLIERIPWIG